MQETVAIISTILHIELYNPSISDSSPPQETKASGLLVIKQLSVLERNHQLLREC
ncbi:hypothetical protein K0M31_003306 [Melipona bicolor]|uniref:Uncharacterized protein n=1 Tax=Melipona bicolor TaxID=60889 RepID=A0AA40FYZ2_9HYME|nr:hypothetical protein K0M31_003306 [Melipona bicolor]